MHKNFKELNDLLLELSERISRYRYVNRNEYQRFIDLINKSKKGVSVRNNEIKRLQKSFQYAFWFLKYYKDDRNKSLKFFEDFLYEANDGLSVIRTQFEEIIDDQVFVEALIRIKGKEQASKLIDIIRDEREFRKMQYENAVALSRHYKDVT